MNGMRWGDIIQAAILVGYIAIPIVMLGMASGTDTCLTFIEESMGLDLVISLMVVLVRLLTYYYEIYGNSPPGIHLGQIKPHPSGQTKSPSGWQQFSNYVSLIAGFAGFATLIIIYQNAYRCPTPIIETMICLTLFQFIVGFYSGVIMILAKKPKRPPPRFLSA